MQTTDVIDSVEVTAYLFDSGGAWRNTFTMKRPVYLSHVSAGGFYRQRIERYLRRPMKRNEYLVVLTPTSNHPLPVLIRGAGETVAAEDGFTNGFDDSVEELYA